MLINEQIQKYVCNVCGRDHSVDTVFNMGQHGVSRIPVCPTDWIEIKDHTRLHHICSDHKNINVIIKDGFVKDFKVIE